MGCAAATIGLLAGTPGGVPALAFYGLTAAGLWIHYRGRGGRHAASIAVLLLKYPAITAILAAASGTPPRPAAVAMTASYAAASAFEYLHDHGRGPLSGKAVLSLQALSAASALVILRTF
jgi:hypothetical protein